MATTVHVRKLEVNRKWESEDLSFFVFVFVFVLVLVFELVLNTTTSNLS